MAKIADCPNCHALFGVPEEFTPAAALACPACHAQLPGPALTVRELPLARIVAPGMTAGEAGEIEVDFDLGRPQGSSPPSPAALPAASGAPQPFA
ncbi:MAG TPA: hypothetical protein VEQ85_09795, partial [Lacipirellulaceae bacterium]|nr:hypothetical protein [Lacipirellulaceae bacterium]